jgi:hypothetical protein
MEVSTDDITRSLKQFKKRRDALLHEDEGTFDHHLHRFIEHCESDILVKPILEPLQQRFPNNVAAWWQDLNYSEGKLSFPPNPDEEFIFFYRLLESLDKDENLIWGFGMRAGKHKRDEALALFISIVARPFVEELTDRLSKAADLATPQARDLQAVPLIRIPSASEIRIFLSHKSVDKPIVRRYQYALKQAGFTPWLDESDMAAGTNLERGILQGFEESCAAVFFITENFKDEKYLGAEVDYAIMQKRKKDKKFAIITLRYPNVQDVPGLLQTFIFKDVENDLQGFYEVLRALPIELGPVRWKSEVVK